ncbi:hypothetical protein [Massilia aquatica]|uniref:META domain-containing protein n=1 Tax=Massilia aquatica TaxID=2609000 RepID=A0ABX0M2T4_9BURK|nr:hypothetical protein [Massilia aquatica]NHZ39333.1 hypothetical protein [Massilia aquatica]
MKIFPRHFLVISAILLLSACSDDSDESAPEQEAPELPQAAEQAHAASVLPKVDFWAPLLAGIAGTYDSECEPVDVNVPGMQAIPPLPGPIVVMADGNVRSAGQSLNLRTQIVSTLERRRQAGQAVNLSMGTMTEKMMTFSLEQRDRRNWIMFGMPYSLKRCKIARPLPLSRQSLYTTYAKVLDANLQVECISAGGLKMDVHPYKLAKGILDFEGRLVDLKDPSHEIVTIHADAGFVYSAELPDEEHLIITLDAQGQLTQLFLTRKKSRAIVCSTK